MSLAEWRLVIGVLVGLSACGGGVDPALPDAPPPCEEGAERAVDCGNCGTISEVCAGGAWEPQSECLGEGICTPGDMETGSLPMCGEEQRVCDSECAWTDWTTTTPGDGECDPGETRLEQLDCSAGFFRAQTCSQSCEWTTDGDPCVDECGGAPRVTTEEAKEEVCIPGGDFIRGAVALPGFLPYSEPVATVYVSSFYIDRYSVTTRRYRECIDAGGCTTPMHAYDVDYEDPTKDLNFVYGVTWDQAVEFCAWDGGRRLVTEAEWEKAGRGPAPSEIWYPWGGTDVSDFRCDLFYATNCGYTWDGVSRSDPYDAFPGTESPYGVSGIFGGGAQWVHDWSQYHYYEDPESVVDDPQGPDEGMGGYRVQRGNVRIGVHAGTRLTDRGEGHPTDGGAIRCGRDASAR